MIGSRETSSEDSGDENGLSGVSSSNGLTTRKSFQEKVSDFVMKVHIS